MHVSNNDTKDNDDHNNNHHHFDDYDNDVNGIDVVEILLNNDFTLTYCTTEIMRKYSAF